MSWPWGPDAECVCGDVFDEHEPDGVFIPCTACGHCDDFEEAEGQR